MEMKTLPLLISEENYEYEDCAICELNIPLAQFLSRINEIPKDKLVVLYCNSEKKSFIKIYD